MFWVYKKTFTGVLYSRSFNITLVAISMITNVVMMAISGNLALSLGMVGALSIIRFRTAIKDPKDIAFLFWAIALGIINGIAFYKLSIISSIAIGIVLVLFSRKIVLNDPYVLVINYSGAVENKIDYIVRKCCKRYKLRNKAMTGSGNEVVYEVKIRKKYERALLPSLKRLPNIDKVMMFSYTGDLTD